MISVAVLCQTKGFGSSFHPAIRLRRMRQTGHTVRRRRREAHVVNLDVPILANVTEPGDIVLLAIVLGATIVVGLVLLALDAIVRRVGRKRNPDSRRLS